MDQYKIYSVNGPVVKVTGGRGLAMMDMVHVGELQLTGEVVSVDGDMTTVQVYEDTTGLEPGQVVTTTGAPMSLRLGPGLLGNIFDGIGRPLKELEGISGPFLGRGINLPALDMEKKWAVTVEVKVGDAVKPGTPYAHCQETAAIVHRCLVPAGLTGTVTRAVADGDYTVDEVLVEVTDGAGRVTQLKLSADCPIRSARPMAKRLPITRPLGSMSIMAAPPTAPSPMNHVQNSSARRAARKRERVTGICPARARRSGIFSRAGRGGACRAS
mgnify:CR=1 FL=1